MPVEFIDGVSTDEYGELATAELAQDGVGLGLCLQCEAPTCLATVTVDGDGKASYEFRIEGTATFAFAPQWLPQAQPPTTKKGIRTMEGGRKNCVLVSLEDILSTVPTECADERLERFFCSLYSRLHFCD